MSNMRDGAKASGATIAVFAVVLVVAMIMGSMAVFGWGFFQRSTADFRGQTSAIEKTKANAAFRLSSYNGFFDLCSAIQGNEARIRAQEDYLPQATEDDKPRVQATIAAIKGSREGQIRKYNADAAKSFTQGQFRDSKLPYQINPTEKETTCVIESEQ